MKAITKTAASFVGVLLIATVVFTGSVMGQTCPEACIVSSTKVPATTVAIYPDSYGNWPIVVNDSTGPYKCGDPSDPNSADNYPCLAWPYQCTAGSCQLLNKVDILIPTCCDKAIKILWTSKNAPKKFACNEAGSAYYKTVCSGYDLTIENISGLNPPPAFWFTTPKDVGTNVIDMRFTAQSQVLPCLYAIQGPGCNTQIPPVRVESRTQCWQFTADTDNCHRATTWYAEWVELDPCAVAIYAARAELNAPPVPCDQVKIIGEKLTGELLGNISIDLGGGIIQPLTESLVNNAKCSESWLRFTNPQTGCNVQCILTGGRKFCY